jgi:hypothetical protein
MVNVSFILMLNIIMLNVNVASVAKLSILGSPLDNERYVVKNEYGRVVFWKTLLNAFV